MNLLLIFNYFVYFIVLKDVDDYEKWRSYNVPNMADVLKEFPSVHIDPEFLLTQLPLLQPRYYSISSSRKVTPREVHLTMSVVSYKIHGIAFDTILFQI